MRRGGFPHRYPVSGHRHGASRAKVQLSCWMGDGRPRRGAAGAHASAVRAGRTQAREATYISPVEYIRRGVRRVDDAYAVVLQDNCGGGSRLPAPDDACLDLGAASPPAFMRPAVHASVVIWAAAGTGCGVVCVLKAQV